MFILISFFSPFFFVFLFPTMSKKRKLHSPSDSLSHSPSMDYLTERTNAMRLHNVPEHNPWAKRGRSPQQGQQRNRSPQQGQQRNRSPSPHDNSPAAQKKLPSIHLTPAQLRQARLRYFEQGFTGGKSRRRHSKRHFSRRQSKRMVPARKK